jgi:DNA polymerase I-like protein with 3'-5' exonuclease and polymerase domains
VKKKGKNRKIGSEKSAAFLENLPAMGKLITRIKRKAKATKSLTGLDGRALHCRSDHSAPNTLFQSAGAVVMKKALVILDRTLQETHGYTPGNDYEFCANVHDEWQIECRPELAETVGRMAVASIRQAGEHFQFRCPLDGDFAVGRTWADTH